MTLIRRWLERRRHARRLLDAFPVFPCVYAYDDGTKFVVYTKGQLGETSNTYRWAEGLKMWRVKFTYELCPTATSGGDGGNSADRDRADPPPAPGPPVDFHWNGDEYIAVERKEEATGGGTNGGGHGV